MELRDTSFSQANRKISNINDIPLSNNESNSNNSITGETTNGKDRTRNNRNGNHYLNREGHQRLEGVRKLKDFRFAEAIQGSLRAIAGIRQITSKVTEHIKRIILNINTTRKTITRNQSHSSRGIER